MIEAHPTTKNKTKDAAVVPSMARVGVQEASAQKAHKLMVVLFVATLGLGLLAVTGFAQSAHDVAHDARHAFSVPCH